MFMCFQRGHKSRDAKEYNEKMKDNSKPGAVLGIKENFKIMTPILNA